MNKRVKLIQQFRRETGLNIEQAKALINCNIMRGKKDMEAGIRGKDVLFYLEGDKYMLKTDKIIQEL